MTQLNNSARTLHGARQKALSLAMILAGSLPLSANLAMANAPMPNGALPAVWSSHASMLPSSPQSHSTTSPSTASGQVVHSLQRNGLSLFHNSHTSLSPVTLNGTSSGLNLTSSQLQFLAGNLANFSTLTIDVGGHQEVVQLNTKLTAAELVAFDQVQTSGTQTIHINADGAASGGTILLNAGLLQTLDTSLGGSLPSLTIAHGVNLVDTIGSLSINGSLTNYGAIYTASNTGGSSDSITATSIANNNGGLISSLSSALARGGLYAANFTLNGQNGLSNAGTINSTGDITIAGATTTNTGTITSAHGNVDFSNSGNITVNGSGGTIQANQGQINFRDSSYNGSSNLTLNGGNYLSQAVNLNAGTGTANTTLGQVSGVVNATADSAHIGAATTDLKLGNLNIADDPTYFNTGNISIDGSIGVTNGMPLAIIAGGNIIGAGGALDTAAASGGGNLLLVAGANYTTNGASTGANDTGTTVSITGFNPAGGYIDLAGVLGESGAAPVTAINTSSSGGQAGNIIMIAYAGSAANSGSVITPVATSAATNANVAINAAGATPAQNGNVTITGNGTAPNGAILIGDIVGNSVSISGQTPSLTGGNNVVVLNGAIQSGSFGVNGIPSNTFVQTGAITASTAATVNSGGKVTTGDITSPSGAVTLTSSGSEVDTGNITVAGVGGAAASAGANGGSVTITAANGIFTGNIDACGGGGGGGSAATPNGAAGGAGGTVNLTAMGDNIQVGSVNVSGGGGGGGAGATANAAAGTGGAGGAAGTIVMSTPYSIITNGPSGALLAFNGGAGAAGGAAITSGSDTIAGAGGGGGGAYGGGGGGGAGGISTLADDAVITVAGGGGGAGVYGGGGGAGTDSLGTAAGGAGGSSYGPGAGGLGEVNGSTGSNQPTAQEGGAGGNPDITGTSSTVYGGFINSGGQGGSAVYTAPPSTQQGAPSPVPMIASTAASGGNAFTSGGSGSISITFGATSYKGTPANNNPLELDAASLSITGTSNTASVAVNSNTDGTLVTDASLGGGATLTINAYGNLTFTGTASAGTIILTNNAQGTISNTGAPLTAFTGELDSSSGNINVSTAFDYLTMTAPNATVSVTNTSPLNHALVLQPSNVETLNLSTTGNLLASSKTALQGSSITLNAGGNTGTETTPFLTNAAVSLTVNEGTGGTAYIKDLNTGNLFFTGGSTTNGGIALGINLQSAASTLNMVSVIANNVSISDTNTAGIIQINPYAQSTAQIGSGGGSVSLSSIGSIFFDNAPASPGILGSSISLVSKSGSVGGNATGIDSQYVEINGDGQVGTLTGSGATGFLVKYDGDLTIQNIFAPVISVVGAKGDGSQLNIAGPIGNTKTSQIYLVSDAGISSTGTTSIVEGKTVQMTIWSNGNIGTAATPITTEAGTLNLYGNSVGYNYASNTGIYINQIGSVILGYTGGYNVSVSSSGTLTAQAPPITGDQVYAANSLYLYGAKGLTIAAGEQVVTENGSYSVKSGPIIVNGTVSDYYDSTTLSATGGNLQVTGAGSFPQLGASMTLSASGNIIVTATDPLGSTNFNAGVVQNLTITAGGYFQSPFTSYSVIQDTNGNGGSINVTASALKVSTGTTGPITFNAADGGSTGNNGGSVAIDLTGTTPVSVTANSALVPKGGTQLEISTATQDANSGSISVTSGGNLEVDDTGFTATGAVGVGTAGANLSFSSAKTLTINVNFVNDTAPLTQGSAYGNVYLSSGASTPFIVGTTSSTGTFNGSAQQIVGANITIKDIAGITINDAMTVSSSMTVPVQLSLITSNLQNNAAITMDSGSTLQVINPSGALSINTGTAGSYSGVGAVDLEAQKGNLTLTNLFTAIAPDTLNAIKLVAAGGTIALPSTLTSLAVATDSNGNGGSIDIQAKSLSFSGPSGFALNAAGTTGNGGSVTVNTTAPLTIGSGASMIAVNVSGAAGSNGGTVSLTSTGNLTADLSAVSFGSALSGSTLSLAGSNVLISNVSQTLTNGILTNLTITSNSSSPFVIGGATKNGIIDPLTGSTISADSMTIANNGGAISQGMGANPASLFSGSLTLLAKGNIGQLAFTADTLTAESTSGSINLTQTGNISTILGNISTAASQSTTLSAGNGVELISNGDSINTGKLDLTGAGSVNGTLYTNAATIEGASSGPVAINDSNIKVTIAGFSSGGDFTLAASGAVTVTGAVTAVGFAAIVTPSAAANETITFTGKEASLDVTGNASGASLSAYSVKSSAAANTVTASTVNLATASTTAASILQTSAQNLEFFGGAINVQNTYNGNATILAPAPLTSLTFSNVAGSNAAASSLTVGSISTTNGGISITTNSGVLNAAASSIIETTGGKIALQTTDATGNINVGADTTISAYSLTPALGTVTLAVGKLPTLTQFSGTVPTGLVVNQVLGGKAYLGGKTADAVLTVNGSGNVLTAEGASLILYSGGTASGITLNGGDQIIADPPKLTEPEVLLPSIPTVSYFSNQTAVTP